MKIIKTHIFPTLPTFVLILLMSCCPDADESIFLFNIESIEPVNFNYNSIEFIEGSGSEISALSYSIVFYTTAPIVKDAKPQSRGGGIFRSPDCSGTIDPKFVLEDPIVSLSISATNDFSDDYPTGTDLTELFSPIYIIKDNPFSTPSSSVEYISGSTNIQDLNKEIILYHEIVDYRKQIKSGFYGFRILKHPLHPTLLQFKLTFHFQSGRTISGLTKPILLS